MATATAAPKKEAAEPTLRKHALGFPTLIAQSIALISPTMTAVPISRPVPSADTNASRTAATICAGACSP